jgi:hypothetical protein
MVIQALADATDLSQSLANRRHLPGHEKVRSTTLRRGRASNPVALLVRLTIWRVNAAIVCRAPLRFLCQCRVNFPQKEVRTNSWTNRR